MTADHLKDIALLAEFSDEDREALAELLESKQVTAGRRIFSEGSESEGLVLVVSGTVKLQNRRTEAPELVEAPVALGALSLVAVGPRECTAFADSACEIVTLPRTSFRRLVDDYPRTACRLVEGVIEEASGLIRAAIEHVPGA